MPSPQAESDDGPLFELYHENSKQRRYDLAFGQRIYAVNSDPAVHRALSRTFMSYPGAETVSLPDPGPARTAVEQAIASRRSQRRFTGAPVSLDELSRLLRFGNGITGSLPGHGDGPDQPVRAAPSGGALFPVELYAAALSVDDLDSGIHHYNVARHACELMNRGDHRQRIAESCSDPDLLADASAVIILTAVLGRGHFKYGERAYRFALFEAGHIAQNLVLTAGACGLGAVPVGGFVDEEVELLLDVDGTDETVLYLVVVGRPGGPDRSRRAAELMEQLLGSFR